MSTGGRDDLLLHCAAVERVLRQQDDQAERTVIRLTAFSARAAAAAKSSTAYATSAVHSARTHVWASAQGPTTSCPDTAPFAFTPQWWES